MLQSECDGVHCAVAAPWTAVTVAGFLLPLFYTRNARNQTAFLLHCVCTPWSQAPSLGQLGQARRAFLPSLCGRRIDIAVAVALAHRLWCWRIQRHHPQWLRPCHEHSERQDGEGWQKVFLGEVLFLHQVF